MIDLFTERIKNTIDFLIEHTICLLTPNLNPFSLQKKHLLGIKPGFKKSFAINRLSYEYDKKLQQVHPNGNASLNLNKLYLFKINIYKIISNKYY